MPTARRSSKAATRTRARKTTTVERASRTARRAASDVVKSVSARVLPALPHDAVKLLEKDHRRFERLMKEGEETTPRARTRRRDILGTLAAEIAAHERKEEKLLYPALKRHRD